MRTYVISDLHGRLDLLEYALAQIEARPVGRVIFTGDYIDRGPDSAGVVYRIMAGPKNGWLWTPIRGNHEDMLLQCRDGDQIGWWMANGGMETLKSYGGFIPNDHVQWMDRLPRLTWDEHRVYTHAGVSEDFDLDSQPEAITQWFRYPKGANVGWRGMHVVHGHTPQMDGPELYSQRTNLDIGGVFCGRLAVGVFDDDTPGGPVEIITIMEARA